MAKVSGKGWNTVFGKVVGVVPQMVVRITDWEIRINRIFLCQAMPFFTPYEHLITPELL
jgi:hypothetical protein